MRSTGLKRHWAACAIVLLWPGLVGGYARADTAPELRYDPPPDFYHSAIHPPEDFSARDFNASLQVYPFRPFSGNIEQLFQRTLLRDWLDPRYREEKLGAPPVFGRVAIRGADAAYTAQFADSPVGLPKPHLRMLIVVGNQAAIVDASASSLQTWQRAIPLLNAFSTTLRVEQGAPVADVSAGPGAEGAKIAGLYMGSKMKYVVDLNRPVGYGKSVAALHYYLFSSGGRVYRAYDMLAVPGNDPDRFDFDAAQRNDPVNSGRYAIQGKVLTLRMGGQPPETITAPAPDGGRVIIETVLYVRQ